MNKLMKFELVHLFKAKSIPWAPEILSGLAEKVLNPEYSLVSCFSETKLEAVFAIKKIHSDVGECIALVCGGHGNIALHKGAIMVQRYWKESLGYRRIQATVRMKAGFEKDSNWLERLGFKKEGFLMEYEKGIDHLLFGKVM